MKFNINEYVKVRLTQYGKDILYLHDPNRIPKKEDQNGWSEWQLWDLMSTFGGYIYLGCDPPFETEIEIVENA